MEPDVLWAKPTGGVREFLLACIAVHLEEQDEAHQAQQRMLEQQRRDSAYRAALPVRLRARR